MLLGAKLVLGAVRMHAASTMQEQSLERFGMSSFAYRDCIFIPDFGGPIYRS